MPAVIILSRYNHNYTLYHWSAQIRILRYLNTTSSYKLHYTKQDVVETEKQLFTLIDTKFTKTKIPKLKELVRQQYNIILPITTYSDSDWATCKLTRRSLSGRCTFVSGNLISWVSSRQKVVALSSCEAEYIAAADAAKDGTYMVNLLHSIFPNMYPDDISIQPLVNLYCDNQGAIYMALNEVNNNRTKHIDIRHHYIRQKLLENFAMSKVHTDNNIADVFTKPLDYPKFSKFVKLMGIYE